ncbi:hypothetical protein [Fodinicurvata sediminis]|uniref:hypothetical protein n=1 Tax=Fodinicurvata sediminis TaxID=1121832 RepID=UPI0003B45AF4|nr:hypothetical protein [Fodinicurvata sediminis]
MCSPGLNHRKRSRKEVARIRSRAARLAFAAGHYWQRLNDAQRAGYLRHAELQIDKENQDHDSSDDDQ